MAQKSHLNRGTGVLQDSAPGEGEGSRPGGGAAGLEPWFRSEVEVPSKRS